MTETFKLWEKDVPYYIGGEEPTLTYYKASVKYGKGTVILCPGGGYSGRAEYEGKDFAEYLNCLGLDAFVLNYRVAPNKYPAALCDVRRAIRFIRYNAERFDIDKNKIAVMGSSAGGHLAAHASTFIGEIQGEVCDEIDNECYIPNAQILCYPVIDKEGHRGSFEKLLGDKLYELEASVTPYKIASEKTPPAFIWHTNDDELVDVCNSYRYATRLKELGIATEMHIFPFGKHGLGLATRPEKANPYIMIWADLMKRWLVLFGFLK